MNFYATVYFLPVRCDDRAVCRDSDTGPKARHSFASENSRPNKSNVSSYLWLSHHPDRFLLPLLSVARRGRLLLFFSLLVVGKIASSLHAVPVFQTKTSLLAEPASRGSDRLLQFPSPIISAVFNALYRPVKGK